MCRFSNFVRGFTKLKNQWLDSVVTFANQTCFVGKKATESSHTDSRGVAQLARVRGLGPRGRRFKSSHPDQNKKSIRKNGLFILISGREGLEPIGE